VIGARVLDTGVVDEQVDIAELPPRGSYDIPALRRIPKIGVDGFRAHASGREGIDESGQTVLPEPDQEEIDAFGCQSGGEMASHAAIGPGQESRSTFQMGHGTLPSTDVEH